MLYTQRKFIKIIGAIFLVVGLGYLLPSLALAQGPADWQTNASGLSIEQNEDKKTAGLVFTVRAETWPVLQLQGGVESAYGKLNGPIGIDLGTVSLSQGTAPAIGEATDWAKNRLTFTDGSAQLNLWASRLSPAILLETSQDSINLFGGPVRRYSYADSKLNNLESGPSSPRYVAYSAGGSVRVEQLSATALNISGSDANWLLVWYGTDSHFVDTKAVLSYTGDQWRNATLSQGYGYQADAPMLITFETMLPASIRQRTQGGINLSFNGAAGYASLLPLFGREHPQAAETESWSQGLPAEVVAKANWWAARLCRYPTTVSETYSYDGATDTASIRNTFDYLNVCSGGVTFAPIAPMLSIGAETLPVDFLEPVVDGNYPTEFGPILGVENKTEYTWQLSGLKKYTDNVRVPTSGSSPAGLETELGQEVEKLISGGHFAPWIFSDTLPRHQHRGDIYWLNPADGLYHLIEIADVLPAGQKAAFVEYIKSEREAYPPETLDNLPLGEGASRRAFTRFGGDVFDEWHEFRQDVFFDDVRLYNFYVLDRYYRLINETPSQTVWQSANATLERDMSEQDWATLYWFNGHQDRSTAVVNANRHFAGLVGYIRLAQSQQDTNAEALGRALLAKSAVLRAGMINYPAYQLAAGLVELPGAPDWQVQQTAGKWHGYIFNYNWVDATDDPRQVVVLDQFETYLLEHSGFRAWVAGVSSPYYVPYRDMVPELSYFLKDHAGDSVETFVSKVEAFYPHWYMAYSEGTLGAEHNLSHPVDSFQLFIARAQIQQESPEALTGYLDIPWLSHGDLFYIHKLAETIKAYQGYQWQQ